MRLHDNTSTPEAQGIPSGAILAFVQAAEAQFEGLHGFVLMRHGKVVAQGWWSPYSPEYSHMLFSLSKSFTSTGVGLAVSEGYLSIDDPVLSFFPEETPAEVSENLAAMRVRHLLSMSTGHDQDTLQALREQHEDNWAKSFLSRPVVHEPGTHFLYNSGASYMLSAIVQRVTGQTLLNYLGPRLFAPLGIEGATWQTCPRGVNTGGWGLSIKTEDIARFGQMYLQQGVWQGRQIVPAAWIAQATSRQVSNGDQADSDWQQGYGFQFWRCRHGAYRGDGAFGQYCLVMPQQDAVLAITSGIADMQAGLNVVWEHLLPAMGPAPLPEDGPARAELAAKLAQLALPTVQGAFSSPIEKQIAGKKYVLEPNEGGIKAISFDASGTITLYQERGEEQFPCGKGVWQKGMALSDEGMPERIAASGAWVDESTYQAKVWYYQTPFGATFTCRFAGNQVTLDSKMNVSFGPLERPQLVGRMA